MTSHANPPKSPDPASGLLGGPDQAEHDELGGPDPERRAGTLGRQDPAGHGDVLSTP